MIRSSFIIAAVLALLASQAHADEDQGSFRLLNLVLTLKSWPPQGETAALIREKLEEAGFEETDMLEKFHTWYFRPDGSMGPKISEICADLMADERTRTVLESCGADRLILPPMPVRPSGVS